MKLGSDTNYHGPLVLQRNMTEWHQDISVSRLAFHLSKHHKLTLEPLCMHTSPISQFQTTLLESCPTSNYDASTCSRLSSQDTHPFIGSHMPSELLPHDCSPKYHCSLGSTYDHMPKPRAILLHSLSRTLLLSDKLLRHQEFPYTHGPILGLASPCACKKASK